MVSVGVAAASSEWREAAEVIVSVTHTSTTIESSHVWRLTAPPPDSLGPSAATHAMLATPAYSDLAATIICEKCALWRCPENWLPGRSGWPS